MIDSRAFSDFCGIDSSNQVPDGDTLGRFRNLLIRNGIQEKLFAQVTELLQERGLLLKKGTMMAELLSGEEETVHGDSGYPGAEKREEAVLRNNNGKKIRYKINRRPSQAKKRPPKSLCKRQNMSV